MQPEDKLNHYYDLLLKWQKTINLVSPSTIKDAKKRHFDDSRQLSQYIPQETKNICDIGSGAGFPALVLAILNPQIHFNLIESDTRKCAFLRTVSRETLCDNVTIHNDRVENIIDNIKADMVTARALASLEMLINYTEPLWNNNSDFKMVLPKGQNYLDEISQAKTKFCFDLAQHDSVTDANAKILIVGNVIKKP